MDPENPEIAPSYAPWKQWKNEYYEKRGYKVASKDWKGWEDMPEDAGIFKYLGVKVDPEHVKSRGLLWNWFSDWRTGLPTGMLISMPLWMFNVLPPLDERTELAFLGFASLWAAAKIGGPMIKAYKEERVGVKVKMLLEGEKELNDEIVTSINTLKAGSGMVETVRAINDAERSLRALEAAAATKRMKAAQRDALVAQLDYLVQVSASGAADKEAGVLKAARSIVEGALEKDAALQQRTIDAAIKSLTAGSETEDVVSPLFSKALEKAASDAAAAAASQAAAKPLKNPLQVEIFRKRFGVVEDAVTEATLSRAKADKAAYNVLVGKVGGAEPTVGAAYVLKPAIAYAK